MTTPSRPTRPETATQRPDSEPALGPPLMRPHPARVGVWYTAWWDARETVAHWRGIKHLPLLGRYSADDPRVIRAQYRAMRDCGICFVIFDHTNTVFVDNRFIDNTIKAWYDFMDGLPARDRLALCIGFGGELNQHGDRQAFLDAADHLYKTFAGRPSQMRLDGKPLVLWYIEKDVLEDWKDDRFTVRRAYHFLRTPMQEKYGGWGWGSHVFPPDAKECMSIKPGWYGGPPSQPWPRRGGDYYMECWLRILKTRPRYVTIADWNNWAEQTAIEDSTSWTDTYGTPTPDWYRRITRGYVTLLRTGRLISGFYYRDGNNGSVYKSGLLQVTLRRAEPRNAPALSLPAGWIGRVLRQSPPAS